MTGQLNVVLPSANPAKGLEQGLQSDLERMAGKRVMFRSDFSKESIPLQSLRGASSPELSFPISDIPSSNRERMIAATDSSCALIGETEDGAIFAGRVSTVFATEKKIRTYWRAGPTIFYLDPVTIRSNICPNLPRKLLNELLIDRRLAERYIRVNLERAAQLNSSKLISDGIILIDGSLRSSTFETSHSSLREIEHSAELNANQLIGFSKASKIRAVSQIATILMSSKKNCSFADITELIRTEESARNVSNTLLVKFARNSSVLRADFSRINSDESTQLLAQIKHNDILFRGYPETLRLAHHLSVFDSSAVSSIRSYLSKEYRLVQIPSDDLRAAMLGKLI
jgi:NurA domain